MFKNHFLVYYAGIGIVPNILLPAIHRLIIYLIFNCIPVPGTVYGSPLKCCYSKAFCLKVHRTAKKHGGAVGYLSIHYISCSHCRLYFRHILYSYTIPLK